MVFYVGYSTIIYYEKDQENIIIKTIRKFN